MILMFVLCVVACFTLAVIDIFEPRTMIAAVEQIKPPNTFIRDLLFTGRETANTETVDVDLVKGKRKMAPYVSPYLAGKIMDREGFETFSFKPPTVKPRRLTTAGDAMTRMAGENVYDGLDPATRAAKILGKDLREMKDYEIRREEQQCCEALFTGAIHMVGDGVDAQISFRHTLREALTAPAKWTEVTSDPIADLTRMRLATIQESGVAPTLCIMANDVLQAFLNNQAVMDKMDKTKIQLGQINPALLSDNVTFVGTLTILGLDIYGYDDWYIDDIDNTEKPFVPAGTILLASPRAGFKVLYGAYTDMELMQTFAVPQYPRSWVDKDLNHRLIELISRPLPLPVSVNSWYVAVVI